MIAGFWAASGRTLRVAKDGSHVVLELDPACSGGSIATLDRQSDLLTSGSC